MLSAAAQHFVKLSFSLLLACFVLSSPASANHLPDQQKEGTTIELNPFELAPEGLSSFFKDFVSGFSQVDNTIEQAFSSHPEASVEGSKKDSIASLQNDGKVLAETDTAPSTGFLGIIARFFQSLLSPLQDIQVNLASQQDKLFNQGERVTNVTNITEDADLTNTNNRVSNLETTQGSLETELNSQASSVDSLLGRTLTLEGLVTATEKEYTKLTVTKSLVLSSGDFSSPTGITLNATGALKVGDDGVAGVSTNDDDLYVQGIIEGDSDLDIAGTSTLRGALGVSGKLSAGNTSVIHQLGNVYISGSNLEVPGTLKIQGVTYTFPGGAGSSGQALTTDGVGTLSWNTVSGGDTTAQYLTLATSSTLSNERVLTAGTGISFDDTGANGTLTINAAGGGSQWTSSGSNIYYDLGVGSSYVGIGTSSPSYPLHVVGDINHTGVIRLSGTKFLGTAGTNSIALGLNSLGAGSTAGNNIGIGTSALFSNTTGQGNVGIGVSALKANTTGNFNVAVGSHALGSNDTGFWNTAVGYQALKSNTSAQANTAVGFQTLYLNTTGIQNTALGMNAITNNTTGTNNVAAGYVSLFSNTTGDRNLAFGTNALLSNTTASDNIGIGVSAGRANTTGTRGLFIGSYAGAANTTANDNLFIGYEAGLSTTTGTPNLAIGSNALRANTTGTHNIGIGVSALSSNTTAGNNIAIGSYALRSNTGFDNLGIGFSAGAATTSGTRDIFIGNQAGKSNTTGTDNVYLGYEAGFSNTNTTGNIAIGTMALKANIGSENIGIGLSALTSNTSSSNVALGSYALAGNTGGNNNIAIGQNAMRVVGSGADSNVAIGGDSLRNITSDLNTAIGRFAFTNATSGGNLVGVGYQSGNSNTTGLDHVAVGTYALKSNTTGSRNVAVGMFALGVGVSGSNNVGVGTSAGYSSIGSNNIFLGYQAGGAWAGNDSLFIENSSETGDPLIYGDFANNRVGLGTTAPSVRFEVKATGTGNIAKFTSDNSTGCTISDGGVVACSSDATLKKDIVTIDSGLVVVNQLRPVAYRWNHQTDNSLSHGFLAQEVESILPGLVSTDSITGLKSLNTAGIIPYVVAGLKETNTRIDSLVVDRSGNLVAGGDGVVTVGSRLDSLEAEVASLKARLDQLEASPSASPQ